MEQTWTIADEGAMDELAARLALYLSDGDTVLLSGDLGAGKTRFVQGIAQARAFDGAVTSPTFNILQIYNTSQLPIFHFDLYRLDDARQLEDIGFFETVDADTPGASLIEWPDLFPDEMPDDAISVRITINGTARQVKAQSNGPRSEELLRAWTQQT